ncbi:Cullin repeat-like-containing domain protein [Cokeromyces recurvatus]|uniref:Cullin repeat-like-containing domain protein n=1 Tax=Cokeromyces recurvatus TaxID=90255 RepID=UPI00221EEB88|nr:Cullin repeat-like-containing domain protein [Cokeromyces recurvatus]KAI7904033.1 Cullin repeat-like-containing domain protein [Cokeromyces recurvatus]
MKSVGTLRRKGLGGAEHFMKKDKHKQNSTHNSSNSSPNTTSSSTYSHNSVSHQSPKQPVTSKTTSSAPITVDLHRFADDNLQPEEFVRRTLGDAQEDSIRSFYKSLLDAKHLVGGDLQRNVYRNYTEFVSISKEISNLDADVLNIKEHLNELKSIWESFLSTANSSDMNKGSGPSGSIFTSSSNNNTNNRKKNELMTTDINSTYRAQIMALWDNVEGSQRFIPHAKDRYIVQECVNFHDINPRTLQPRQTVHLYLLNDCLLLARKRGQKLIADDCWKIQDINIVDVKDSSDLINALRIVVYPETFIYQAERQEDKVGFLNAYKRLIDDNDDRQTDTPQSADIRKIPDYNSLHPDKEKWLEDLSDQLEVMIALREFEKSVAYLETARQIVSSSPNSLPIVREAKEHINDYTDMLCDIISRDLSNTLLTKIQFQRYVNWLLRLNKSEKARQVFLSTRTSIIKKRIRQLVFEGDITTYISELALVVFTLIRNTCEWYRDSFKQNEMASGFITWVREQTEIYADIYKRQVFGQGQLSCQIIADCFKSTLEHCSMLRKVGLDLKFLLEDLFVTNVKETIIAYESRNIEKIEKIIQNDNFHVVSGQGLGNDVQVTSSVISFYNLLVKFSNDICLLSNLQLYSTVVNSICKLTEHYLRSMVTESDKKELTKEQKTIATMNVSFILDNVVPRISSQLNYHFNRPIPELDTLRARLRELSYKNNY